MSFKPLFAGVLAGSFLFLSGFAAYAQHHGKTQQQVSGIVELFTSQGCSSCPAADKLFHKYVNRKDIVALSFSVDYWDYLGWKDTLGSAAYSNRQRDYAIARHDGEVYTPQIVINGQKHVVGSNERILDAVLKLGAASFHRSQVKIAVRETKDDIYVDIAAAPKGFEYSKSATIWLALIKKKASIKIRRGENRGRHLTYYNVVKKMNPLGKWMGKAMQLRLPREEMMDKDIDGCTILLQVGKGGPLVGASEMGR